MNDTTELLECIEKGFKSGYKRAVDKAVEWLKDNLPDYWQLINANDCKDFLNKFKQAMNDECTRSSNDRD